MKKNLPVTHREQHFSGGDNIFSTTNLKGAISYVNEDFIRVSGFEASELLGKNHNVVRHPEMPPEAFKNLWDEVKQGHSWMGMVKNRCKNGDHYWVDAFVTPISHQGQTEEYQSVRRKPRAEFVQRAEALYAELLAGKQPAKIKNSWLGLRGKMIGAAVSASLLVFVVLLLFSEMAWIEGLLGWVAMSLLSSAIILYFLRPLELIVARARAVANDPLARYIYTGRNDDIGMVLLAFKKLESESAGIIGRLADASSLLNRNATDLHTNLNQTNQGVQQQYAETDQVATAINQMTVSIQEVAHNAQLTSGAAIAANEKAADGMKIVQATMQTIESLEQGVEQAARVMQVVEKNSGEISTIVDVIQSISEQTNLLALNAAIEAARAGEHGRGFAVVADEVRGLANRTNQATQEIQAMIEKLQSGTREAVVVMHNSKEQAGLSVQQSTEAVASLNDITAGIGQITDMSAQIATAVEQQRTVADEINHSIVTIRGVAEQTMERANISLASSISVRDLAGNLSHLSEEFWTRRIQVS
ncbi:PAS domain S-box protein [Ectothiorhodospiraceae bacterium BW-2]|nr:PAS domain S-box protein [Ectothiorhodospiraceae bacterium BW-2]